jgi:phosphoserine phosphatase
MPDVDIVHIVDFDGTIYRGNSFHHWLIFLFTSGILSGRLRLSAGVVAALARRITRGGHSELKKSIQRLWREEVRELEEQTRMIQRFNRWQKKKLRQALIDQIRERGGLVLVATAAPCDYMEGLRNIIGFDALLCTRYEPGASWVDNSRERKLQSVCAWLGAREREGQSRKILYTDHADDFSLLEIVDEVVLVGEIARTGAGIIKEKFPSMPCRTVA